MKRLAALVMLAIVVGGSVPVVAKVHSDNRSQNIDSRKAAKKQQKAQKKYAKAQRKAERKMLKTERKNTKYPSRQY